MNPNPYLPALLAVSLLAVPQLRAEEAKPGEKPAPAPAESQELDFGDHSSSTITGKAWAAYGAKKYGEAKAYAQKCIDMYGTQAAEMQKGLKEPATDKEEVFKSWALNDVGTCYYILGQSLEGESKAKEAMAAYKTLVDSLSFAQCWDEKGWFWKPADAARERVKALEFELLK